MKEFDLVGKFTGTYRAPKTGRRYSLVNRGLFEHTARLACGNIHEEYEHRIIGDMDIRYIKYVEFGEIYTEECRAICDMIERSMK